MAKVLYININQDVLRKNLVNLRGVQAAARTRSFEEAKQIFEEEKQLFLEGFENHPISQELNMGSAATSSAFLDGEDGSLFGFIGFEEDAEPVQDVANVLEDNTSLSPINKFSTNGTQMFFSFPVKAPSLEELATVTDMPSPLPGSWLKGIEKGISGLTKYIYRAGSGRSGAGLQAKKTYRKQGGAFKPVKYYTEILNEFINRIKGL